ncbi:hypothetical protein B0H17DRAFT_1146282 [Mycena rosella]|uniref:Uncharacterized protein n=1 Tax=Mycena rosella TaxID=1033263 RepID=A0AAD7G3M7_MYCRO|nr:hypothetical protein B0H17DRAFT_1146282 [Mycena rosella]
MVAPVEKLRPYQRDSTELAGSDEGKGKEQEETWCKLLGKGIMNPGCELEKMKSFLRRQHLDRIQELAEALQTVLPRIDGALDAEARQSAGIAAPDVQRTAASQTKQLSFVGLTMCSSAIERKYVRSPFGRTKSVSGAALEAIAGRPNESEPSHLESEILENNARNNAAIHRDCDSVGASSALTNWESSRNIGGSSRIDPSDGTVGA